jgi:RHS repeat-associated protein
MSKSAGLQGLLCAFIQASYLLVALLFSSTVLALPKGSYEPVYAYTSGNARAVSFPPDFVCEGTGESIVFSCADQIRQYNTGRSPILAIVSMSSPVSTSHWDVEYIDERDAPDFTPRNDGWFAFNLNFRCNDGDKLKITSAGERYCQPVFDAANECKIANPVSIYTGEKFEEVIDFEGNGLFPIQFKRHYHSLTESVPVRAKRSMGSIGNRWDHSYSRVITGLLTSQMDYSWDLADGSRATINNQIIDYYTTKRDAFDQVVTIYRPDEGALEFSNNFNPQTQCFVSSQWQNRNPRAVGSLVISDPCDLASEYIFTDRNEVKEIYDSNGLLIRVEDMSGVSHSLTYSNGLLSEIRHSLGYGISFEYDNNRISAITDTTGGVWAYRYDAVDNLHYVDSPDMTTTEYHYEDPVFPSSLTGITDQRGIRYAHYHYDVAGRVESEYHGPAAAVSGESIDSISILYDRNSGASNQLKNSRGFTTEYWKTQVNGYELPASIQGPGCATCGTTGLFYEYDPGTYDLLRLTDNGHVTKFDNYGITGNPGLVTEAEDTPQERSVTYTYDPQFQNKVAKINEPSVFPGGSKTTSYSYDVFGNTTSITVKGYRPDGTPVSRTRTFNYDGPYHQLSEINGPQTDVEDIYTIEYYPDDIAQGYGRARMKKIEAPLGILLYDNITYTQSGKYASYITGTNLQIEFSYYPGNERLEKQTMTDLSSGESRSTYWTYLATGEIESITRGYATPDSTTVTFVYDNVRRLSRIYDGFNNYIEYERDSEGNVVNENIYDQAGILQKALNQSFDAYNRLDISTQVNETRDQDFSVDGTLDIETNGRNVVTDYSYDALHRLVSIDRDANGTDHSSANALTRFSYDAQDNLVSVTDPKGGQTVYEYDDLGNMLSISSPDTGITKYSYGEAGNIIATTDAKGQLFSYSYDALGRIVFADAPGESDDIEYQYDSCDNGAGKLCVVTRDIVTVAYDYNAFGEVRAETRAVTTFTPYEHAVAQTVYTYDAAGRIRDLIYPSGNKVTYAYDLAGNIYSVVLNDGEQNLVTDSQYYPFGPERQVMRGNGSRQFSYMDHGYRAFIIGNGSYFYDVIYHDENGNPVTFYSSDGSKVHAYDALDRLNTSSGPYGSRGYEYDINGNRLSKLTDSITDSYSYDTNTNRMSTNSGRTVVLDANGNTVDLNAMKISYTADNRIQSISDNAHYKYNGLGERTMKALNAEGAAGAYGFKAKTVFVYGVNGKLLAETGPSGRVKQEYIYQNNKLLATVIYKPDDDEPIIRADMDNDGAIGIDDFLIWYFNHYNQGDNSREVTGDGQLDYNDLQTVLNCALSGGAATGCVISSYNRAVHYAHNDHLGSPHMLTDETGRPVWSAVYEPFGKASINDDVDGDGSRVTLNMRFPGQYYDDESGLHYNYFRYYDPDSGRYITSDPIGLNGGLNTYVYVEQNPIIGADPFGLKEVRGRGGKPFNAGRGVGRPGIFGCLIGCVTYTYGDTASQASLEPSIGAGLLICGPKKQNSSCQKNEKNKSFYDPKGDNSFEFAHGYAPKGAGIGVSVRSDGSTCVAVGLFTGISIPVSYSLGDISE